MNSPREVVDHWTARLLGDGESARSIDAIYKLVVEGPDGGTWILHCKEPAYVREGEGDAECIVTLDSGDLVAIASGALNPQIAFLKGRLRLSGDLSQALKLNKLFAVRTIH